MGETNLTCPEKLAPQTLDQEFLDLLACPACDERLPVRLNRERTRLLCACGRLAYPVRDGIPIMLVDEAEVLDENIPPGGKTDGS